MTETIDDWYSPETATFGDRVAGAREASGMDQATLSKRLGVKLSTLKDWEDDLSEPRANKLSMMAGILNVSLRWLLEGQGDGIDAPVESEPLDTDIDALLVEIRQIKGQLAKSGEHLGRVEKQLRKALKEQNG
ncbi:helix-turn-helix domain-containing protein [Algirhabdus cladophorae]|uniref:helix-turn-helix domain-containing protein n=1 Tax=Algirhabdus cladophorae TaxID=3377108 RepID=UPI003B84B207